MPVTGGAPGPGAEDPYAAAWAAEHGGAPTGGVIGGWLRMCRALAAPLARRRVDPSAVTVASLAAACLAALPPALTDGRWAAVAAAALIGLCAVLDGVDGAVALLSGRVTTWGAVLDSVVDRLSEVAFVVVLRLLGADPWWCLAGLGAGWMLEYVRARAAAVGVPGMGPVTVGERPTRVAVAAMFALATVVPPGDAWATAGAVALTVTGLVGFVTLLVSVRRRG